MTIEELKRLLIARGRFSPETIVYWLQWFDYRESIPPSVEEAEAWMSDMEEQLGDCVAECSVLASWHKED
jgi:hypothetical protein